MLRPRKCMLFAKAIPSCVTKLLYQAALPSGMALPSVTKREIARQIEGNREREREKERRSEKERKQERARAAGRKKEKQ